MSVITSLFTVSTANIISNQAANTRTWCRPTHKPTCCIYVVGGNACCLCIPASATCFVIEMWAQGGGGAGSCCCMGACTGGQAGDYAWVVCTTSSTVHTLCACACNCTCNASNAGLFTGSPGTLSYVTDCSVSNCYKVAASACGGSTCCNGMLPMGAGINGTTLTVNPAHSPLSIQCCCYGFWSNNWGGDGTTYDWTTYINPWSQSKNMPFQQIQGTNAFGITCNCCPCFNFYVRGGCGWSDPSQYGCTANQPTVNYCGAGLGRGGTAYAGGLGQLCDCNSGTSGSFGGYPGNAPGGGGSSASTGTGAGSCCLGSCGGLSLILISYC